MIDPFKPNAALATNFITDVLGATMWSKQHDMVRATFGPKKYTLVASCTGAGKTKTAADIGLAWLCGAPQRGVITTAPTIRQIRDLLWAEVRSSYKRAAERGNPLGGSLLPKAPHLSMPLDKWEMLGFASRDEAAFQGYHYPGGTLVILDEAVGVEDRAFDALDRTLTGEHDRMLCICNPTTPAGRFYEWWGQESPDVEKITISAFDIPNVIKHRAVIRGLTSHITVEKNRAKWGEDSPMWIAGVLGQFPQAGANVLVPLGWAQAAVERWKSVEVMPSGPVEAGVDLARFGADATVVAPVWFGKALDFVGKLNKTTKHDMMEVTGFIMAHIREHGMKFVRVDGDAMGGGVVDRLAELGQPVVEMRGGRRASDPQRFVNARSEWLWNVRCRLDPSSTMPPLAIPPDEDLISQMTSMRFGLDSQGRIVVESKDDWKKRRGRADKPSPDELDALAYALADRVTVSSTLATYLAAYG